MFGCFCCLFVACWIFVVVVLGLSVGLFIELRLRRNSMLLVEGFCFALYLV